MTTASCWTNPQWNGRDPGAFAVVIGVSHYDHVAGGNGTPAADNLGLGQLQVSALTAYRIFEWLRDGYCCDGISLARCWLALSPTPEECAQEPALADYERATFDTCENAVTEWFAAMRGLDPRTAKSSKSLFFFCGHGLELYQDEQLLLPSDYLAPPGENPNKALRTLNLRRGLTGLSVPSQQFFIDSCRNDHSRLRERGIELRGSTVLREEGSAWANSEVASPIVYATTAGAKAYQPRSVRDADGRERWSLFGSALLDGVREPPAEFRTMERGTCQIDLYQLVRFMGRRVSELLAAHGATASQPIVIGGILRPPSMVADLAETTGMRELPPLVDTSRTRAQKTRFDLPTSGWKGLNASTMARDVFGSQEMAAFWGSHRLHTVDGQPVQHELVSVIRNQAGTCVLTMQVPDASKSTVWQADDQGQTFSCRLPPLGPDLVLRFEMATADNGWQVSVAVDQSSPDHLGRAADVWQAFADGDMAGVLPQVEPLMRSVLDGASPSAFPALVAALIQLRLEPAVTTDFLHTLVLLYPNWPDFRILLTERLLRSAHGDEVSDLLARALADGFEIPFVSETFGYAAAHARAATTAQGLPRAAVATAERAVADYQPGSFFCTMLTSDQQDAAFG